ncbi:MAG TPA: branched-chain amino acid ABC transporter permease [Thermomicrobiales bacterium]|nr:branched-chain amino acid ABC transporter permease [Thermomicrobiales bacterium]
MSGSNAGDVFRLSSTPAPMPQGGVIETPLPERESDAPFGTPQQASKPLPAWEHRLGWAYTVVLAVVTIGLIILPSRANDYSVSLTLTVLLTICMASSWNLISGFTGYVSFGHAGFFGIGAYTGALLIYYDVVHWALAMLLAGLMTTAIALVIGYPTLRLRGPYFAITMLGLTELARIIVTSWESLTFGGRGVYLPILYERSEWLTNYYAMLILTVTVVLLSYAVGTSRFGLRLFSIRDDEGAAQAMGIDTTRHKLAAFALSSFFPGVAGAIYARHTGYIDPLAFFAVIWSIRAIATSILGGQGTILGPIIGAVVLTLVSEQVWALDPNAYQMIFGGLIVLVVLFMPGGLIALLQRLAWLPRSRRL